MVKLHRIHSLSPTGAPLCKPFRPDNYSPPTISVKYHTRTENRIARIKAAAKITWNLRAKKKDWLCASRVIAGKQCNNETPYARNLARGQEFEEHFFFILAGVVTVWRHSIFARSPPNLPLIFDRMRCVTVGRFPVAFHVWSLRTVQPLSWSLDTILALPSPPSLFFFLFASEGSDRHGVFHAQSSRTYHTACYVVDDTISTLRMLACDETL